MRTVWGRIRHLGNETVWQPKCIRINKIYPYAESTLADYGLREMENVLMEIRFQLMYALDDILLTFLED